MAKTQNPFNGVGYKAASANKGSGYKGGQQGFTDKDTGKVSNGGKLMSHRDRWKQVRAGLGMTTG